MNARRMWALENAACAFVVFGTITAVLLFDGRSVRAESASARTGAVFSAVFSGESPNATSNEFLTR